MSPKETLLYRLTELMFENQQSFLLLDELYEDVIISPFVRNIQIDSPFQQLVFDGVLSQYNHQNEIVVSFTVEAYFHHLLAKVLQKDARYETPESLLILVKQNKLMGLLEAVSNLLSFDVEFSEFKRTTQLIDLSNGDFDVLKICVIPLINSLLIHGGKKTAQVILENNSANDWKALYIMGSRLTELDLDLKHLDFLNEVILVNPMNSKYSILVGLIKIIFFDKVRAIKILNKIDYNSIEDDEHVLLRLGNVESYYGNYFKALNYYEKSLVVRKNKFEVDSKSIVVCYNNIGNVYFKINELEKSLEYFNKSLEIQLKNLESSHTSLAIMYNNIGMLYLNKHDYDKSLEFCIKSLDIRIKTLGKYDTEVADSYNSIGGIFEKKAKFDKALEYFNKGLVIRLKNLGNEHPKTAISYNNIGGIFLEKGNFELALEYYQKSLHIRIISLGEEHPNVAMMYESIAYIMNCKDDDKSSLNYLAKSLDIKLKIWGRKSEMLIKTYNNIGITLKNLNKFKAAIENFKKAFKISKKANFPYNIAKCYEALNDQEKALDFYIQSAEIRKQDPEVGLEAELTIESINNAKRLAKQLNKENELPQWIKNTN